MLAQSPPSLMPGEFVRYAVALRAPELCRGFLAGWLSAEDTVRLAFLRRCDLAQADGPFQRLRTADPSDPCQLAALCRRFDRPNDPEPDRIWQYLALARSEAATTTRQTQDRLADGRREFLLDRAAAREGMNWENSSALMGTDRPEEVDAAFARGEELVGVAVIGLALTHPDPTAILPRVARALESPDDGLRHQGVVALAHVARLHRTTDARCLELLRAWPRGSEADDDLWAYVPRRRLPLWIWRHKAKEQLARRPRERRRRL